MNQGYVKLWRKSLDAGWLKNHKLWIFWTYCLMKATYKPHKAIIGNREVFLEPGQFIFGRRVAANETGLTERQIRTILAFLINAGNLTIKTTNKYSVITIVNWHIYQQSDYENDPQNDQQVTSNRPHTIRKESKNNNKGDFFDISSEISALVNQLFPSAKDEGLFRSVKEAIASTRKGKKVSESVILKQLKQWEKFPPRQVHTGIKAYLDKQCHVQGKNEKYLLGIIRNSNGTGPAPDCRTMKSTGSYKLDEYYRNQGIKII